MFQIFQWSHELLNTKIQSIKQFNNKFYFTNLEHFNYNMNFDKNKYQNESITLDGETVHFRSYRNLVYVSNPVDSDFQQMNIFVPAAFYEGNSINGYGINNAPVFMPNSVGGYMPGPLDEPGLQKFGPPVPNSIFRALQHGYVVAAPAIRGRILKNKEGKYNGKAPACIVDYKAAIRYLHYYSKELPGDESKIITNGTSAGGALSSLAGATGNHPDYEPYLKSIGALPSSDDIFAASCYCPITNLEHADSAYEWEFNGVNDFHRKKMTMNEGGRPSFTPEDGTMTPLQIKISSEEAALFPSYVNSLNLVDMKGNPLQLDEKGDGSFKEHIKQIVLSSAQRAIDKGIDVSDKKWLTVSNKKAISMDFAAYAKEITRMKSAPAFDNVANDSPENDLFGNETTNYRHFTKYSFENSTAKGLLAEPEIIKLMNPMNYIEDDKAKKAKFWRIRHGECDRDTSLAISAILELKLTKNGMKVDYHSPWNTPHSGDYDLDELFAWIDSICK